MKNTVKTVVVGMAFMSFAALASSYVPDNVAWLKASNSDPLNPTSWPGAGWWRLDGASAPLDVDENAGQDYGVKGFTFRPKIGEATFPGKSLTIGALDYSSSGTLLFRTANGCDTTFANEGLFLYAGAVQSWNPGMQIVRGKVTVRSDKTAPVKICFTDKGGSLAFCSPVESISDKGIYLHSLTASSTSMNQTNFVCRFLGNALSAYNGSIDCCPVAYEYRNAVSWYTKADYNTTGLKPPYFVTFQSDSGTMPGTLTLYPNAIIAGETSATDFSVGTLASVSLNGYGTNFLSVALASDGSKCSIFRVTGTLDLQSPMAVRLSPDNAIDYFMATNAAAAMRLPILKAPASVVLDPAKFFMERDDAFTYLPRYELEIANDSADGLSTLWLVRRSVAWSLSNDGWKQTSFERDNWTDGGVASVAVSEKDYLALHNLRTVDSSDMTLRVFPGNSLTLGNSTLGLYAPNVRIDDLRVVNGTINNTTSGRAEYNFMEEIKNKSWVLDGRIRLSDSSTLTLACYNSKGLRINSEISGGGIIDVRNENRNEDSSFPLQAYVGLFGTNENFRGRVTLTRTASTTLDQRLGSNLAIRDPRNLGGPLSKWTYNALTLGTCCGLYPLATLTLDDETRGIYVNATWAFFAITNDVVFTCKERITYKGVLIKDGKGELALGGPQPYFEMDGGATPQSGKNVLDVWEGTLRPVSAAAFQGLALVVTNAAATLAMDIPVSNTDEDIGQYGMLNTVWDAPLTVPAGGLTVQLRDSNGVFAAKGGTIRVPICTVNATARAALDGKLFARAQTDALVVSSTEWTDNGDGSFTFAANVRRNIGFVLTFR